jgi:hypothetical protein
MSNVMNSAVLGSIADLSTDVFFLAGMLLVLIVWGFTQGREVLVSTLLALYPAMLVTSHFPYEYLVSMTGAYARLLVFVVTVGAIFFIVRKRLSTSFFVSGVWRMVEASVFSVAVLGLFSTALYHVVDLGTVYQFSSLLDTLFLSSTAHIAWLVGPLICIPLVIRS